MSVSEVKENEIEDEIEDDLDLEVDLDADFDDAVDEVIDDDDESEDYEEEEIEEYEEEFPEIETTEYIIADEDRVTSDVLSKYEIVELINIRATQISKGNRPFTDVKGLRNPNDMAKKEIFDNQCPLLIKRHIGNNKYEIWNPNEMSKPKI